MGLVSLPRTLEPEIMDDPGLDAERHYGALRGLARINRWSGSVRIVWPAIVALCKEHPDRTFTVLDLATGGGDIPLELHLRSKRMGLKLRVRGCDCSPRAVEFARERAAQAGAGRELEYFVLDALNGALPSDDDVLLSSLFLHHLNATDAETLLRRMAESAQHLVLINDLLRSRTGLLLAQTATRLLSRSAVVHADGPQSVRAAFTIAEIQAMAERAGLSGCRVEKRWPCRFLLNWRRGEQA